MSVKIGNTILRHGIMLAPMAGFSDRFFRRICFEQGAEYTVSEMVSAKALCYDELSRSGALHKSADLAYIEPGAPPTAVQIFGGEPDFMKRAASLISTLSYRGAAGEFPCAIDINMGCPVRKVTGNGEGSALMKDPERAAAVVRAVAEGTSLPVTVKIRAGWDRSHINAPELAKRLEASGAALICVHGRTRDQFYLPGVDLDVIKNVKKAVSVPVIGNGDISSAADAMRMLEYTGCDGLMLARGTLGNPWLFREISSYLDGKPYIPPTDEERIETAVRHASSLVNNRGNRGVAEARGRISLYTKGFRGSASARASLNSAETFDEMKDILYSLLDRKEQDV